MLISLQFHSYIVPSGIFIYTVCELNPAAHNVEGSADHLGLQFWVKLQHAEGFPAPGGPVLSHRTPHIIFAVFCEIRTVTSPIPSVGNRGPEWESHLLEARQHSQ